jgi:hypothetical protein
VEIPAETARFPHAEATLGEDFAGGKVGELGGDPPSDAPVTYYLLKILTMICSASLRSPPATPRSSSIRREGRELIAVPVRYKDNTDGKRN